MPDYKVQLAGGKVTRVVVHDWMTFGVPYSFVYSPEETGLVRVARVDQTTGSALEPLHLKPEGLPAPVRKRFEGSYEPGEVIHPIAPYPGLS